MDCHPRILEPSKPKPSSNASSSSSCGGALKCCHVPRKSRNLKSTTSIFFSFISFNTSPTVCGNIWFVPPLDFLLESFFLITIVVTSSSYSQVFHFIAHPRRARLFLSLLPLPSEKEIS